MAIKPTGHIFYQDEYEQKYEVHWTTTNGILDITTIIQQPYIWGGPQEAKIINKTLYRKGIVTIHRQAIEVLADGYIIVAEGSSQYYDFVQMNYNCEPGPADQFKFHLDSSMSDDLRMVIASGSCWVEPDVANNCLWCDLNADGSPILVGGMDYIQWIDTWS